MHRPSTAHWPDATLSVHIPLAVRPGGRPSFDQNLSALLERKRKLMHDTLMPPEATSDSDRDILFRATVGGS